MFVLLGQQIEDWCLATASDHGAIVALTLAPRLIQGESRRVVRSFVRLREGPRDWIFCWLIGIDGMHNMCASSRVLKDGYCGLRWNGFRIA